jgi:hypothetical protein
MEELLGPIGVYVILAVAFVFARKTGFVVLSAYMVYNHQWMQVASPYDEFYTYLGFAVMLIVMVLWDIDTAQKFFQRRYGIGLEEVEDEPDNGDGEQNKPIVLERHMAKRRAKA